MIPSHFLKRSDVFLDNNGLVSCPSVREEACLGWATNMLEYRLDFIHNNFCDSFIGGVAEANGPEVPEVLGIPTLRDEAKKGVVMFSGHDRSRKYIFAEGGDLTADIRPELLVE